MSLTITGLSGSLRAASTSRAVLHAAGALLPEGVTLREVSIRELPHYDADLQPLPEAVVRFKEALAAADGVLVVTPEYNHSVPGVLKNALDWASRPAFAGPLTDKPVGVVSSSTGAVGGARAQAHLKDVLLSMGAAVLPGRELALGGIAEKLDADGVLVDEASRVALGRQLAALVTWIERVTGRVDR